MHFITSTQEAIECYKRSLVGADPKESHVKEKLARLLAEVGDHAAAIEYHKLLVESEVADADGGSYWHLFRLAEVLLIDLYSRTSSPIYQEFHGCCPVQYARRQGSRKDGRLLETGR